VSRRARILALGDLAALLVFALIGLTSHDRGITLAGLARDWLPIATCYAAAALGLRAWTRPGVARLLGAWALGVTAGVVVRGLALGREPGVEQLQFLGVTLTVTLVLLAIWRALEATAHRRRATH
jgi:hypothetical protein